MIKSKSMTRPLARIALAAAAVTFAAGVAAADLKPEQQIETRQAGYKFMAWNMVKIKANLSGNFDAKQVQAAANAIAGIANSGMGALFGPGTDKAIGDVKTRVKPELFKDREQVGKLAGEFVQAADGLQKAAAGGDQAAVKKAFGTLGAACKACHDKYRAEE
jgi:cytochrome c556